MAGKVVAQPCLLPATVEFRGSSASKTKVGHAEYQSNGTGIPKRYLVETVGESADPATLSGSGYTSGDVGFSTADSRSRTPLGGTATFTASLTWPVGDTAYLSFQYRSSPYNYITVLDSTDFGGSTSGSGSYGGSYLVPEGVIFQMTGSYGDYAAGTVEWEPDDTPGTQTSTYTYDSGPTVEDHNGGLELYSGSLSASVTIDSPTAKHYDTTSSYLPARRLYTLSDEYTTPELESYARNFLTQDSTWGQPVKAASRALATNELSITVQNCQARIAWHSKPLEDYLVQWEEVTTLTGQAPVRVRHRAFVAGNGYAPMQFETPWVQPPAGNGTINICKLQVTPVTKCDGCDVAGSPGVAEFKADGADFGFDLGAADFGRPSGRLSVSSLLPSATLSTPASLTFRGNTNLTDVVEVGGTLRQAFSGEHLADVVTNDAFSYQIRFFSAQNVLGKVAGLYVTQNDPYTTWHIRNPNGALDTNELLVVEERDGSWNTNHYQYLPGSNTWELTRGNGYRRETVETVWNAGSLTETKVRKVFDAGDALTSEKHEIYTLTTNGLFLTSEVFDPNGLNLVTTHTYDTYGRPVTRDEHSGYWEQRTYDTSGRLATLTQVRNNRTNILYASESVLRTDYAYTPASGSGDDGAIAPLTPRTTVLYDTDGYSITTLARTYIVLTNGFRQDIRCRDAAAAWTDGNNLVTTTRYYTNGPFKDFVHTIDHPDQTRTVFFYESNATQRTTIRLEGAADPSSPTNILTGTQSILVQGTRGETLLSETYFKNSAAQVILTDRQVYEYLDELKLSHRVLSHNGTTQTVQYGCCGLEAGVKP